MAIDCPCNNNSDSPTGFAIVDETAKALERKLAKLATEKRRLDLANQVRLAELELVDLCRSRTPCSTPTINASPRHTRARIVNDINEGLCARNQGASRAKKKPWSPCGTRAGRTGKISSLSALATKCLTLDQLPIAMTV